MLDQEYQASWLQPSELFPTENVILIYKEQIGSQHKARCLNIPHSAQNHPFQPVIDAAFSLCALPIVSEWIQQHLFHQ